MCGISGIAWSNARRRTLAGLVEAMTERIAHRGPDGVGYHEEPGLSFGHRRLSIIDLEGGKQPLANEILFGKLEHGGEVMVKEENGELNLSF